MSWRLQELSVARTALALELFFNLLAIAGLYPGQPEKLALFMRQDLLEDHPAGDQPPVPPPAPPSP